MNEIPCNPIPSADVPGYRFTRGADHEERFVLIEHGGFVNSLKRSQPKAKQGEDKNTTAADSGCG
jgi:hypothetical protein